MERLFPSRCRLGENKTLIYSLHSQDSTSFSHSQDQDRSGSNDLQMRLSLSLYVASRVRRNNEHSMMSLDFLPRRGNDSLAVEAQLDS